MSETPEAPKPAEPAANSAAPQSPPADAITPEVLKAALKAFRKRLKVTQLDNNSRLGKSPMTSGSSELLALTPPNQYPKAVWDALVAQGKLKYAGQGMYELRC